MSWQEFWNQIVTWIRTGGLKLLFAVAVLILTFALINWFAKKIGARAE